MGKQSGEIIRVMKNKRQQSKEMITMAYPQKKQPKYAKSHTGGIVSLGTGAT